MRMRKSAFALTMVFTLSAPLVLTGADRLSDLEVHQYLALIKPQPGEDRWAEIPWMVDLWEARQKAARLGKPIFIWQMDGHPLAAL